MVGVFGSPDSLEMLADLREHFDCLADDPGSAERDRMAAAFGGQLPHEVRFWQMTWSLERWQQPDWLPDGLPAP